MAQKTIPHSLRTITLNYDDAKPETDYEKELLRSYIQLHDSAEVFSKTISRLNYEYKEHEDAIADAEKEFQQVEEQLGLFYKEAQRLTNKLPATRQNESARAAAGDLYDRVHAYHESITKIQEGVLNPLYAESTRLNNEAITSEEEEEKLGEQMDKHEELATSLNEDYDRYSLDLVSYDDDEQDFKDVFSRTDKFNRESSRILQRYNKFTEKIKAAYANWDKTIALITGFFDDKDLLDSSLSESYANGTGDPAIKPIYLIDPADTQVNEFRHGYGLMASSDRHTMVISVTMEVVRNGEVGLIQKLIMQLQHFPKMIEKWIFAIKTKFLNQDSIPMQDSDWKGVDVPMSWFRKMSTLPCTIFFLEDHDARGYAIMGDLLAVKKLKVEGTRKIAIEGENLELICNRLFEACWFFHLYCHNTGFDPQPAIEALLAEFDLPVTYEQVKEEYESSVKKGIQLKMVPFKGDEKS